MPRFVILRHELPRQASHWDVMLQGDDGLMTWSITEIPTDGQSVVARRLPDHRAIYLDYEGPVSGHRGHVSRWDAGTYELLCSNDRELAVRADGHQLKGLIRFEQMGSTDDWKLTFESMT